MVGWDAITAFSSVKNRPAGVFHRFRTSETSNRIAVVRLIPPKPSPVVTVVRKKPAEDAETQPSGVGFHSDGGNWLLTLLGQS